MNLKINIKVIIASIIIFSVVFASFISSCKHTVEPIDTKTTAGICFDSQVLPLFQANCAIPDCHSGLEPEGDISFENYNSIMEKITPNSLSGSKVYKVITKTDEDVMPPPPKQPLNATQIAIIEKWILEGAKNTSCQ
ncbi:MAG: hypothetical protein QG635_2333 [Bacteroidota bacterium]|nr:hypothetical protein [Bacteroidota bacterium]